MFNDKIENKKSRDKLILAVFTEQAGEDLSFSARHLSDEELDFDAVEVVKLCRYARTLIVQPCYLGEGDRYNSWACKVHDTRIPYDWLGLDPFRGNHVCNDWSDVYERCTDLLFFLRDQVGAGLSKSLVDTGPWTTDGDDGWLGIGEALAYTPDFQEWCGELPITDRDWGRAASWDQNRKHLYRRFDTWLDVMASRPIGRDIEHLTERSNLKDWELFLNLNY
tara:strand:+ start:26216 stop:26881 length:666 start_codon:yes stop_codon:yes gene_type:complete